MFCVVLLLVARARFLMIKEIVSPELRSKAKVSFGMYRLPSATQAEFNVGNRGPGKLQRWKGGVYGDGLGGHMCCSIASRPTQ